jgi:hypothetical protein
MSRKAQVFIAIAALLAAAGVGVYVYASFARMVTTAQIVTPATLIPAGALIEPGMLTGREAPRPLLEENVYVRAEDLAGRVAVVPLSPGMVIYRPFAVTAAEYRLVDDPVLEVVSFPVDPARAVGGQLQPGHRVDVWRLVAVRPSSGVTLTELTAGQWATATLLVEGAPVVDVRAATGMAVARSPQALPGQVEQEQGQRSSTSSGALQILTVAVPRVTAREILALVAEEQSGAQLWVSLAPLTRAGEADAAFAPPAR